MALQREAGNGAMQQIMALLSLLCRYKAAGQEQELPQACACVQFGYGLLKTSLCHSEQCLYCSEWCRVFLNTELKEISQSG